MLLQLVPTEITILNNEAVKQSPVLKMMLSTDGLCMIQI